MYAEFSLRPTQVPDEASRRSAGEIGRTIKTDEEELELAPALPAAKPEALQVRRLPLTDVVPPPTTSCNVTASHDSLQRHRFPRLFSMPPLAARYVFNVRT